MNRNKVPEQELLTAGAWLAIVGLNEATIETYASEGVRVFSSNCKLKAPAYLQKGGMYV